MTRKQKQREKLKTKISDIIQGQVEHFIGTKETSMHMAEQILKLVEDSEEPVFYNKVMEMREEEER